MSATLDVYSDSVSSAMKKQDNLTNNCTKEDMPGSELWTDGLICAFEFVREPRKTIVSKPASDTHFDQHFNAKDPEKQVPNGTTDSISQNVQQIDHPEFESLKKVEPDAKFHSDDTIKNHSDGTEKSVGSHWVPIGWARIYELAQTVQVGGRWSSQAIESIGDEDVTVADVATPYWERAAGPTWWCHVTAGHKFTDSWLSNAQWLHPAISLALRDESRLISDRMKHLFYEVPVRVAGGILFELLGQSVGDPFVDEDDIPIVLRSWKAQNFLISVLHVKGPAASHINVLGITEVQELLAAGGPNTPRTIHEVIAQLACRLSRWDDRLFRKYIFGSADEIELKFMNRRNQEDVNLFSVILNQEIRKLSRQVIRVKWCLHAREEIIFELTQHLNDNSARNLLEGIRKTTRDMIGEQEAVRGRLFTIQDVMQSTVRSWLQDRSLRITHNLTVFGGCGLVLSIITGLFGINVDGIPGAQNTPYAFGLFSALLIVVGIILIAFGNFCLGLRKPISEGQVQIRQSELQRLVKSFQREAENHAKVRLEFDENNLPPVAADMIPGKKYVLVH
ncbi:hypothetical protein MKW98_022670 [Papaver atlanticum]|uniref:Magnesium transporter CorA-like family protein n=1 Tax=Papaver atlanticum TaxID=357466 RepID=A0AAD4T591_9MAGN|nr:hypothetical protein MKW98_022670 [Papaver atlanticum]